MAQQSGMGQPYTLGGFDGRKLATERWRSRADLFAPAQSRGGGEPPFGQNLLFRYTGKLTIHLNCPLLLLDTHSHLAAGSWAVYVLVSLPLSPILRVGHHAVPTLF